MIVNAYRSRVPVTELCRWLGLAQSVYYYRARNGRRGARASTHTMRRDGTEVDNAQVVEDIRRVLDREFCCYGYHNITAELRDMGYRINHKKVYRLMDENNLLLGKVIRTKGKREFVQHRRIAACRPMEYLCMDIKYVWVEGERRHYYLLTILDVYTRKILAQTLQISIRKTDVIRLFGEISRQYGIKGVTVRNDNGSQFMAHMVRQYLESAEVRQQFTHIATPEENSYIEAFHSIVDREIVRRFEFSSSYEAKITFEAHRQWYNQERKHGQLGRITPQQKWDGYEKGKRIANLILALRGKAEAGHAGEQPARNSPVNGDGAEGTQKVVPSPTPSLLPMP